jgi:hypothetical protein
MDFTRADDFGGTPFSGKSESGKGFNFQQACLPSGAATGKV